jgi:hypothetical protein
LALPGLRPRASLERLVLPLRPAWLRVQPESLGLRVQQRVRLARCRVTQTGYQTRRMLTVALGLRPERLVALPEEAWRLLAVRLKWVQEA